MGRLKAYLRRLRRWFFVRRGTPRYAAAGTVALIIAGAAWLAVSMSSSRRLDADLGVSLQLDDLPALTDRLREAGIDFRVQQGRVLTRRSDLSVGRALADASQAGTPNAVETLRRLAGREDLWQSSAQGDRRWLVARMAALSELVSAFPAIRTATVLLEPGTAPRLGRPGVAASAAVQVTVEPGHEVTPQIASAIAELVSGGVAGLPRESVRIVDSAGRVCHVAHESDQTRRAIAAREAAEAYYVRRIKAALTHVDGLAVTVRVAAGGAADGGIPPCRAVHLSVPDFFGPRSDEATTDPNRPEDESQVAVDEIRRRAARAAGLVDMSAVELETHPTLQRWALAPDVQSAGNEAAHSLATVLGVLVLSGAGVLSAALLRRRGARQDAASPDAPFATDAAGAMVPEAVAAHEANPDAEPSLAFLQDLTAEQLVALLRREHPQTMAAVLGSLSPGRAAAVLASLEPQKQVDVIRRLASSEAMEPDVVREVAEALHDRLVRTASPAPVDGVSAVAEILNHADYASERTVLEGLATQEPELADSVLRRMFEFDDILALSDARLRTALESVAPEEIAVALRTAGPEICGKVLAALPAEEADSVREEMEQIGPVRLSDVEAAQQRLAAAVRRSDAGQYVADEAEKATRALA